MRGSTRTGRTLLTTPPLLLALGMLVACGEPIQLSMQFQSHEGAPGSVESYALHPAGLPLPRYAMRYGSVYVWRTDPDSKISFLRTHMQEASAHGIDGLIFTPTALYNDEMAEGVENGTFPPLDEMVRREWVSEEEPGFIDEIILQRDTIAELVDEGLVRKLILRPFQEAGSGIHDNAGLTPESYAALIEWLVDELYSDLPVVGVILHWNTLEGLAEAVPELDRDIPVHSGVTISMPSHGGMAVFELSKDIPALEGLDFATRSWETAGLKTWIAEFSVWDDGRVDPITGWEANGLADPSVIEGFFQHYRNMSQTGLLAGITWLNKVGFTNRDGTDPDAKDGRWDTDGVHPDVRQWWIDEITVLNGYGLTSP